MSVLRNVLLTVAAFVTICCCKQDAHADPLVLSLSNPVQTGAPGQTVTFSASLFNGNPTALTLSQPATLRFFINLPLGQPPPNLSITPYTSNFFNQTVVAGGTLGPLPMFTLTLDANASIGAVFTGTFCIDCMVGDDGVYSTNSVPFTLTVDSPTVPVPEPASIVLLGTGLTGLIRLARRGRSH